MRTWRNLAAPDDANAWYDVDGFWPTSRKSYETVGSSNGTEYTATSSGTDVPQYAFVGNTLSSQREFVVDVNRIWEFTGIALTNVTGGVTVGSYPMIEMYGNIPIMAMGVGTATVASTGGANFAALAGAPQAEIVLVCSNAVIFLNTNTSADGWAASDVGDYTNYTTGEAATGRLIATPGPIIGGCVFNDAVYAFKRNAIYRMRYVGGLVKWQTEVVWAGADLNNALSAFTIDQGKYSFAAGPRVMVFEGEPAYPNSSAPIYAFDGTSPPYIINPETNIGNSHSIRYDPNGDRFTFVAWSQADMYFYKPDTGAWGRVSAATLSIPNVNVVPVMGVRNPTNAYASVPVMYAKVTSGSLKRFLPTPGASPTAYVQTAMVGTPDRKTTFDRVTPRHRRRTAASTSSLEMTLWREMDNTSAQTTRTITESTYRKRFDLLGGVASDTFARFKITYTLADVEIDDVIVKTSDAGAD